MHYLRLPATLVLHVNRAQPDGSRCETPLEFDRVLDLERLNLVAHFGQPLDRELEPCSTQYGLIGVVFHKGTEARSGHYFAYVLVEGNWMCVDDESVETPQGKAKASPMFLEASEPAGGARAALLFYHREDA